jgi:hypothetical protein
MPVTVTYMLELTEDELCGLWSLLMLLKVGERLDGPEGPILEKVQRLMEGQ